MKKEISRMLFILSMVEDFLEENIEDRAIFLEFLSSICKRYNSKKEIEKEKIILKQKDGKEE